MIPQTKKECTKSAINDFKRVILDFETRSTAELKKTGAYKYSLDPTTQPTCLAFKARNRPSVGFLDFKMINTPWKELSLSFRTLWRNFIEGGYLFIAHNAFFDRCIYDHVLVKRYGWPEIPATQWRCTAAKAAACALPRSLAGAGEALGLSVQKDFAGNIAMLRTCKPTNHWRAWKKLQDQIKSGARISEKKKIKARDPEPPLFLEPHHDPITWAALYKYCKIDVLSEEALDKALPDLIPAEQEVWFLNQRLNSRGLRIDIPTVHKIVDIMERESKVRLKELDTLTMGLVTKAGARNSILEFLKLDGIELPDIRAKTVDDVLKDGVLSEDGRRLLEIRKALSKTSTKKYQGMLHRANEDERVRDILLYHGAGTGRDSGSGIQPQNFPKGVITVDKNRPYTAIENVVDCDEDTLRLLYGDNLSMLFSSVIRNVIIPSPGCELFVADFSKVEVGGCWWMAGNKPGLKVLNSGGDPYKYQATHNTGKKYEDIPDDGPERALAKAQILGCQFGMGWKKFQSTAWDYYRLKLTEEQSKAAVSNYRETNPAVPQMWKNLEQAAIAAVEDGVSVKVNKCKVFVKNKFLWLELPSGRRLAYREPRITWRETEYGPRKTLEFWGVSSKTKKWGLERTWGGVLTNNAVQGMCRDLMKHGELLLEKIGYRVLLLVHDEIICEREKGKGSIEEFESVMCTPTPWADESLPVEAKGWNGPRYRK